jgi:hypothetical protein
VLLLHTRSSAFISGLAMKPASSCTTYNVWRTSYAMYQKCLL